MGDRVEIAWVIRYGAHVWQSPSQVRTLYQKALAIFEEAGDERGKLEMPYRLGWITAQLGNYQEAEQHYLDGLALAQEFNRRDITLFCLYELGYVHWVLGNYQTAETYCQESITIATELGWPSLIAYTQRYLARIALSQNNLSQARTYLQNSLAIYEELGLRGHWADTLGEMGHVALAEQDLATAAQLAEESLTLCQELDHRTGEITPYTILGEVALGLGKFDIAGQHFRQASQIACEVWQPALALHALVGLARLFASVGEKEQAYDTATFILHHPISWKWSKDTIAPLAAELEAELPPNERNIAQTQASAKNLEQVVEELITTEGYHA
ncbi:MAG: tetratricopeptide repeat protein [Anaerolineae bacterium]|nr:tetratricopeptide repeat protein [Anaerolineae bacterium]